jgi:hypothetical protein
MATYKIIRHYENGKVSKVVRRGLTLHDAQSHCRNPETSSTTARSEAAVRHTRKHGRWFDGYTEEK